MLAWVAFGAEWVQNKKVSFNGLARTITVNDDVIALDLQRDVWSRWVDWRALPGNDYHLLAMRRTGYDAIPGGRSGLIYFLQNGWKLIVDLNRVRVTGVLYSDDYETAYWSAQDSPIYPATVSALVNSAVTTQNVVTGTALTAEQTASAVWAATSRTLTSASSSREIETLVFSGRVVLSSTGTAGTTFPIGTYAQPVSNLVDAKAIMLDRGFGDLLLRTGSYVLSAGAVLTSIAVLGEHPIDTHLRLLPGVVTAGGFLSGMRLYSSQLSGDCYLRTVSIDSGLTGVSGRLENCTISGTISTAGNSSTTYFLDCKASSLGMTSPDIATLDLSSPGLHRVAFRDWVGPIRLVGSTNAASVICLDVAAGSTVTIDNSCVAGTLLIRGSTDVLNYGSMSLRSDTKLSAQEAADATWSSSIEGGYSALEIMRLLSAISLGKTTIVDNGGGNATVAFRDLNDLKTRVSASMTGSQRSVVTKDVSG